MGRRKRGSLGSECWEGVSERGGEGDKTSFLSLFLSFNLKLGVMGLLKQWIEWRDIKGGGRMG